MDSARFYRRFGLIILAIPVVAAFSFITLPRNHQATVSAPPVQFTDMSGKTHRLSDFRGKTIILNFWASWCAPCVKEFPALLAAAQKHSETSVLIALSADLTDEPITEFIRQLEAQNLPVKAPNVIIARDREDIAGKTFQISEFPVTFVIDGQGSIRTRLVGAGWRPEELESFFPQR